MAEKMTAEELLEKDAREIAVGVVPSRGKDIQNLLIGDARIVLRVALEEAAKACEQQERDFLSDEYATGQPVSSIAERFACTECAAAIRADLVPQWNRDLSAALAGECVLLATTGGHVGKATAPDPDYPGDRWTWSDDGWPEQPYDPIAWQPLPRHPDGD